MVCRNCSSNMCAECSKVGECKQDGVMTQVFIPRYRLIDTPPEKPHYVYVIEIYDCGRLHVVERRYSAFHSLHRQLRKYFNTPLFPPKRVRSAQPKILERRRQSLELYLQTMLKFGASREQIFNFLGIQKPKSSFVPADIVVTDQNICHQPIYKYKKDPYVEGEERSSLPDVVTQGVLSGLYGIHK